MRQQSLHGLAWALAAACVLAWPLQGEAQGLPPLPGDPAPAAGPLTDDGDLPSLRLATERTLRYLQALRARELRVAGRGLPVARLRQTAEAFLALLDEGLAPEAFAKEVAQRFELWEAPGLDARGSMHLTGYHLPLLEARRRPDAVHRFPLYAPPPMVKVQLGRFRSHLAGQSVQGWVHGGELLPLPSRTDIDDKKVLAGQGLELAWVADELGRNAVMVQGSGLLRFEDGKVENLNYAGQNGYPYISLGTALVRDGVLSSRGLTYPKIEAYFAAHPDQLHSYLARNQSYVFFKLAQEGPFGCTGVAVVPGRSIATDQGVYPGGLIGHLAYPRATFGPGGQPLTWGQGGRFVAGHDTGGAIRGPGRIDVYWGGGQEAAWRAGTLNGPGRWRILLRKDPAAAQPNPGPAAPEEAASEAPPPPVASAAPSEAPLPVVLPSLAPQRAPVLDQVASPRPERPQAPPSWLPTRWPSATPGTGGFLPPVSSPRASANPPVPRLPQGLSLPTPRPAATPHQGNPRPAGPPTPGARPRPSMGPHPRPSLGPPSRPLRTPGPGPGLRPVARPQGQALPRGRASERP